MDFLVAQARIQRILFGHFVLPELQVLHTSILFGRLQSVAQARLRATETTACVPARLGLAVVVSAYIEIVIFLFGGFGTHWLAKVPNRPLRSNLLPSIGKCEHLLGRVIH